jgi:hypothetical protein
LPAAPVPGGGDQQRGRVGGEVALGELHDHPLMGAHERRQQVGRARLAQRAGLDVDEQQQPGV